MLYLSFFRCGTVRTAMDNCYIVRQLGHYPECCPTIECENEENQNNVGEKEENFLKDY